MSLHVRLARCNMATAWNPTEIEDPSPSFTSGVWNYFGFYVESRFKLEYEADGKCIMDKNQMACHKGDLSDAFI